MSLSVVADWATVVAAVPVVVAALLFIGRTAPKWLKAPEGLHISAEHARGDLGYVLRVTNHAMVERYICIAGVMPAGLLPMRFRLLKRVPASRNSEEALSGETVSCRADTSLQGGRQVLFIVPRPLRGPGDVLMHRESYRALCERLTEWRRVAGRPISLIPYVRLDDGRLLLGKSISARAPPACLAMEPPCKCGHPVTVHCWTKYKKLRAEYMYSGQCEKCRCRKYRRLKSG